MKPKNPTFGDRRNSNDRTISSMILLPKPVRDAVERNYPNLPPGIRYTQGFRGWMEESYQPVRNKRDPIREVATNNSWIETVRQLVLRQRHVAQQKGGVCLRIDTIASSPFATGLGEEHPLENGFSFLWPYGVPYYPGSGIKGAVRKSAEELALVENNGWWSIPLVWWLFGFDSNSSYLDNDGTWVDLYKQHMSQQRDSILLQRFLQIANDQLGKDRIIKIDDIINITDKFSKIKNFIHLRGALVFWDCYPVPPQNNPMRVDIINCHHTQYYAGNHPPTTCENPNPVYFLTLPPQTHFTYFVEFRPLLQCPDNLQSSWGEAILQAFSHAFNKCGMGAKTAIGYGRFVQITDQTGTSGEKPNKDLHQKKQ